MERADHSIQLRTAGDESFAVSENDQDGDSDCDAGVEGVDEVVEDEVRDHWEETAWFFGYALVEVYEGRKAEGRNCVKLRRRSGSVGEELGDTEVERTGIVGSGYGKQEEGLILNVLAPTK